MVAAGPAGFLKQAYRKFSIKAADRPGRRLRHDAGGLRAPLRPRAEGGPGARERHLARPGADRRRPRPAQRGAGDPGRARASTTCRWWPSPRGRTATPGGNGSTAPGAEPFQLPPRDPVLYYLQRLRDEAHRFAITTHRAGRVEGADPVASWTRSPASAARCKRKLLNHFGSARGVRNAGAGGSGECARGRPGGRAENSRAFPPRRRLRRAAAPIRRLAPRRALRHDCAGMPTDLPNLLTLSRIAAIPLLVALVALRTPLGGCRGLRRLLGRRHHRLLRRQDRPPAADRLRPSAACWTRSPTSCWSPPR